MRTGKLSGNLLGGWIWLEPVLAVLIIIASFL